MKKTYQIRNQRNKSLAQSEKISVLKRTAKTQNFTSPGHAIFEVEQIKNKWEPIEGTEIKI